MATSFRALIFRTSKANNQLTFYKSVQYAHPSVGEPHTVKLTLVPTSLVK